MQNITVEIASKENFAELADWLVAVGQTPQQQCLHTWSGGSADALRQEMLGYWEDGELVYVLARQNEHLVGAMGSEFDVQLQRAWLRGPHIVAQDWEALAGLLFTRLLQVLPEGIHRMDAYLNIENRRGRQFYIRQEFKEDARLNYDFWLEPAQRVRSDTSHCIPLAKQHHASFSSLLETIFPNAYYSPARLIQMNGKSHHIMVIAQGAEVLGFVVSSVEEGASSGEVQFLGIGEPFRHLGYGRQLLLAAVDWLFDEKGVERVCLNVGEERVHARALYESAGFRLKFTGIAFKKDSIMRF